MRSRAVGRVGVLLVAWALLAPEVALAGTPTESTVPPVVLEGEFAADRVIVGFEPGASAVERVQTMSSDVAESHDDLTSVGALTVTTVVELPDGVSVEDAIAELSADPNVTVVEPDYVVHTAEVSDDPLFVGGELWGMEGEASAPASMYGSGAAEAWAAGYTGSNDVYVGIVDEGIQIDHPDLAANIWTNPYDPVDGVDNDGNGYVDDIHGWDFYNDDNSVYDGEADPEIDAHGTHVAGTIGAVGGNGTGVAGVNWHVTMISAKFLGPDGGYMSGSIAALNYLADLKERHNGPDGLLNIVATNNSWQSAGGHYLLQQAIDNTGAHDMLFISAAGNDGENLDYWGFNPASYPCNGNGTRSWDCNVAVAAMDSAGQMAAFSNYGLTVELGAPGVGILSTVPHDGYAVYDGTSMAAPHVTGAVALCASINPALSPADVREAILDSTRGMRWNWYTASAGGLDVNSMVAMCGPSSGAPVSGVVTDLRATLTADNTAKVTWTDTISDESWITIETSAYYRGGMCESWTQFAVVAGGTTSVELHGLPGGPVCIRIKGGDRATASVGVPWSNTAVWSPFRITSTALPSANLRRSYYAMINWTAAPFTPWFAIVGGSFPPGLFFNGDGSISGTPAASARGTWTFTVQATDYWSGLTTEPKTFTINVLPQLPVNFKKTSPAKGAKRLRTNRVTLKWQAARGAASYQYCVDTIDDNQCNGSWVTTRGRFAYVRNLAPGTTYYWQVRAVNSGGYTEANVGVWSRFTTRT